MDPRNDEQTELLRGIWNEMKELGKNLGSRIDQTNTKLDQTNSRLDQTRDELRREIRQTNVRLEQLRDELSTRITQSEIHTATAITDLIGTLGVSSDPRSSVRRFRSRDRAPAKPVGPVWRLVGRV
jgi:phage shock protein A